MRAYVMQCEQQLARPLQEEDMAAAEAALVHAWAYLDEGLHKEAPSQHADGAAEAAAVRPLYLRRFRAEWVYVMMCTAGVSLLERQRRYDIAVERLQVLLGEQSRAEQSRAGLAAGRTLPSGARPRPQGLGRDSGALEPCCLQAGGAAHRGGGSGGSG